MLMHVNVCVCISMYIYIYIYIYVNMWHAFIYIYIYICISIAFILSHSPDIREGTHNWLTDPKKSCLLGVFQALLHTPF